MLLCMSGVWLGLAVAAGASSLLSRGRGIPRMPLLDLTNHQALTNRCDNNTRRRLLTSLHGDHTGSGNNVILIP